MLQWLPPIGTHADAINGRIAAIDARSAAEAKRKADWTKRLGPLAPVALFLFKAKTFLLAALKFKFLLSFFAFFGLYWALFGWRFGLGFVLSIAIHEFGHYVAARRRGLKADLPVFLPGLGAYVRWYSQGMSLDTLSAIALAGPFAGLLAAAVCAAVYIALGGHAGEQVVNRIGPQTGSAVWGALAYSGAWLNLINLIPVFGLDGAQACNAAFCSPPPSPSMPSCTRASSSSSPRAWPGACSPAPRPSSPAPPPWSATCSSSFCWAA
jgi:Zn-dependent protease